MIFKTLKQKLILWYARRHPVWFIERYVKVDTGEGYETIKLNSGQKQLLKKIWK